MTTITAVNDVRLHLTTHSVFAATRLTTG